MKDLAPDIIRQRLLIEGHYNTTLDETAVRSYLLELAETLDLRTYGQPIVHAPSGEGKLENEGFDAFVPLIDSGISLYVWTSSRFFAVVLFTCKAFDADTAVQFTERFFRSNNAEFKSF